MCVCVCVSGSISEGSLGGAGQDLGIMGHTYSVTLTCVLLKITTQMHAVYALKITADCITDLCDDHKQAQQQEQLSANLKNTQLYATLRNKDR